MPDNDRQATEHARFSSAAEVRGHAEMVSIGGGAVGRLLRREQLCGVRLT